MVDFFKKRAIKNQEKIEFFCAESQLYNKKKLHTLLFQSAWAAIKTLGQDPKRLDGLMGMLAVLHTWGQNLSLHNHVHCIVPGGALVKGKKWKSSKKKFLFPVKALSKIYRGIFITKLRALYEDNQLTFPDDNQRLKTRQGFKELLNDLMSKDWVVYSKKPFAGPEKLMAYLGRYTHKIAISNYRILDCNEKFVTFTWRDYSDNNEVKTMQLHPHEFIRRYLQHTVPSGFMRIRSFGFLANACKAKHIETICNLLGYEQNSQKTDDAEDNISKITEIMGIDISICPICNKGRLRMVKTLPRLFGSTIFDTS